jgi:hypothetical protein
LCQRHMGLEQILGDSGRVPVSAGANWRAPRERSRRWTAAAGCGRRQVGIGVREWVFMGWLLSMVVWLFEIR